MGRAPSVISYPAINEQIPLQGKYKMKKEVAPFDDHLFYWLSFPHHLFRKRESG